jgi:uncharacterized protein (TIGR02444 family)
MAASIMAPIDTTPTERGSPFWRFSLAIYARPEVARACLELQDTCGADVNLLLFLLWLALSGRTPSADTVGALDDKVREWREAVIAPLRTLRRALKQGTPIAPDMAEPLRIQVKALELEAERLQQETLYALADALPCETAPSPAVAAQRSIAAYQGVVSRAFPAAAVDALLDALEHIDAGAFADHAAQHPAR